MTSRPILFSAPMVRALLDGSKTQTRRVCKPAELLSCVIQVSDPKATEQRPPCMTPGWFGDEEGEVAFKSSYGVPGDQLWVRETFLIADQRAAGWTPWVYAADYPDQDRPKTRWKPSIFMPRAASRITLEITGVRVELLQNITAADALAEGVIQLPDGGYSLSDTRHYSDSPDESYASLWEHLNGEGSWNSNPWVWVIEFKKVKP